MGPKKKQITLNLTLDDLKKIIKIRKKIKRHRKRTKQVISSSSFELGHPKSSSAHLYSNAFRGTDNLHTEQLRLQDQVLSQKPQIDSLRQALAESEKKNKLLRERQESDAAYLLDRVASPSHKGFSEDDGIDVPTTQGSDYFPVEGNDIDPIVVPSTPLRAFTASQPTLPMTSLVRPDLFRSSSAGILSSIGGGNSVAKAIRGIINSETPRENDVDVEPPARKGKAKGNPVLEKREALRMEAQLYGPLPDEILNTTRKKTIEKYIDDKELDRLIDEYRRRGGDDPKILNRQTKNKHYIKTRVEKLDAVP